MSQAPPSSPPHTLRASTPVPMDTSKSKNDVMVMGELLKAGKTAVSAAAAAAAAVKSASDAVYARTSDAEDKVQLAETATRLHKAAVENLHVSQDATAAAIAVLNPYWRRKADESVLAAERDLFCGEGPLPPSGDEADEAEGRPLTKKVAAAKREKGRTMKPAPPPEPADPPPPPPSNKIQASDREEMLSEVRQQTPDIYRVSYTGRSTAADLPAEKPSGLSARAWALYLFEFRARVEREALHAAAIQLSANYSWQHIARRPIPADMEEEFCRHEENHLQSVGFADIVEKEDRALCELIPGRLPSPYSSLLPHTRTPLPPRHWSEKFGRLSMAFNMKFFPPGEFYYS